LPASSDGFGGSVPLHQPFEVIALVDRAGGIGKPAAQLLHGPARALGGACGLVERPVLSAPVALRPASERIVSGHLARPAPASNIRALAVAPLALTLALALHLLLQPLC